MSGLLIGILLARTASGVIAGLFGWRVVFVMASASMLLLAGVLMRALPDDAPSEKLPYGELLGSVIALVREQPVLRRRMALGAVGFGCFSALWTPLAFLLSAPPYNYGNIAIGLFGLAGVAGAARGTHRRAPGGSRKGSGRDVGRTRHLARQLGAGRSRQELCDRVDHRPRGARPGGARAPTSPIRARSTRWRPRLAAALRRPTWSRASSAVRSRRLWPRRSYSSGGWIAVCGLGAATAALGVAVWGVTEIRLRAGRGRRELATGAVEG